jgi:hypothetical protein
MLIEILKTKIISIDFLGFSNKSANPKKSRMERLVKLAQRFDNPISQEICLTFIELKAANDSATISNGM